ncbi:MAG TPA: CYTH domain-containing protein [Candidatus Microsaccharimonas sp.]|jgi:adenylate cyclase class 2
MNVEIEVKFVNVDHDIIRDKLKKVGAILEQPMRLMKRVTIDSNEMRSKNAFIRVRDQGDKVTLTYKQFDELSISGAKEIEVAVNDFDETLKLLAAAGLPHGSFQETKRETWKLDSTEIVLDVWPWLNPYIEIEGQSEHDVKSVATILGLEWSEAVFGDVMEAYRVQYPNIGPNDTVGNVPEVKFGNPLPEFLKK